LLPENIDHVVTILYFFLRAYKIAEHSIKENVANHFHGETATYSSSGLPESMANMVGMVQGEGYALRNMSRETMVSG